MNLEFAYFLLNPPRTFLRRDYNNALYLRAIFLVRSFAFFPCLSSLAGLYPAFSDKRLFARSQENFGTVEVAFISYALHGREIRPEGRAKQITQHPTLYTTRVLGHVRIRPLELFVCTLLEISRKLLKRFDEGCD